MRMSHLKVRYSNYFYKMFFIPALSTYQMSISDTIIYRFGSDSIIYTYYLFYTL